MPSNNSYKYYRRFLMCLKLYLEKKVEERIENHKHFSKEDDNFNANILCQYRDEKESVHSIEAKAIHRAMEYIFDDLITKAPSASMGGDDWLDKFFVNADGKLCTGTWCEHERCQKYDNSYPYYCGASNIPSKCDTWKKWRLSWRSYPENETCQKCKHYKPIASNNYLTVLQIEQINKYKCYCRAKELPENCPKKRKEATEK